jgi:hypothetical protein
MALVEVAEIYVGMSSGVTTTLGTVASDVMDGSYRLMQDTDEMTNTGSAGWFEDVGTIHSAEGDMTIAWRLSTPPAYVAGKIYALVISNNGANYLSGNVRIKSIQFPGSNPKNGVKIQISWKSQGPMTTVHP